MRSVPWYHFTSVSADADADANNSQKAKKEGINVQMQHLYFVEPKGQKNNTQDSNVVPHRSTN